MSHHSYGITIDEMVRRKFVADYVITGAGASGLGFADVVLSESDRSVVIVDRQARPGGHWNFAYPFLRLHGPSANYGVNSRKLGRDTIDEAGTNAGFYELATGSQVLSYFEGLVLEQFLQSDRVTYLPMHEVNESGAATSLLNGEVIELVATRKYVDARYLGSVVPSMREHTPSFDCVNGALLVTPNGLASIAAAHSNYVVIGAGKTSADVCSWLLARGVDSGHITWVRPRDAWFFNRAVVQPGVEFANQTFGGYADMLDAAAVASSVDDLARRYEEAGTFLRIDEQCWPTLYRGATMAAAEIEELRNIVKVVRLGHVRQIEDGLITLTDGTAQVARGSLFVDCTAEGLRRRPPKPFFNDGEITLQYALNGGQPAYSAALVGIVELSFDTDEEKNAHIQPTVITGNLVDLVRNFLVEIDNQTAWSNSPMVNDWISRSRLNPTKEALENLNPNDTELMQIITRVFEQRPAARENLSRLVARL